MAKYRIMYQPVTGIAFHGVDARNSQEAIDDFRRNVKRYDHTCGDDGVLQVERTGEDGRTHWQYISPKGR